MALVLKDRVRETSTTTGTGTLTLAGAVAGYQSFSTIGTGNTTYYTIATATDWEVGIGTWTSPNQLSRDTILASTNAGAAVNLGAGSKDVFLTFPAEGFDVPPAIGGTTPNAVTSNRLKAKQTRTQKWVNSLNDYAYWAPDILLYSYTDENTPPPISIGDYVVGTYIVVDTTITNIYYDSGDASAWVISLSNPPLYSSEVYDQTLRFYTAPNGAQIVLDDTSETGVVARVYIDRNDKAIHFRATDGTNTYPVNFDKDVKIKGMTVGTGKYNDLSCVAVGNQALANNDNYNNIAIGSLALLNNTSGALNTAIGATAMYNNITGQWNFGLGAGALYFSTDGMYNVAIGGFALCGGDQSYVSTGASASNNVAVGTFSLQGAYIGVTAGYTFGSQNVAIGNNVATNGMGDYNTLIGHTAATNLKSGSYNTFIGKSSGAAVLTGTNNTFVGYNSGSAVGTAIANTVIIGSYTGSGAASSTIYLSDGAGNVRVTVDATNFTTSQKIGAGVTSPSAVLHLKAGTATAGTAPLKLTSGTKLTTAEAGAVEYDGTIAYFTPASTARALLPSTYIYTRRTALGLTNNNSNQSILNLTNGVTLQASTSYEVEGEFYLTTTGTTSHNELFGFVLTTATTSEVGISVTRITVSTTATGTTSTYLASATPVATSPSAITSAQNVLYKVRGVIGITTGGQVNPVIAFSTAPGGTSTIQPVAWFKFTPIGASGSNITIGTWT